MKIILLTLLLSSCSHHTFKVKDQENKNISHEYRVLNTPLVNLFEKCTLNKKSILHDCRSISEQKYLDVVYSIIYKMKIEAMSEQLKILSAENHNFKTPEKLDLGE